MERVKLVEGLSVLTPFFTLSNDDHDRRSWFVDKTHLRCMSSIFSLSDEPVWKRGCSFNSDRKMLCSGLSTLLNGPKQVVAAIVSIFARPTQKTTTVVPDPSTFHERRSRIR